MFADIKFVWQFQYITQFVLLQVFLMNILIWTNSAFCSIILFKGGVYMLIGEFWGTSDAAGIPAPFCACDVCREAREKGGRYQRTRSCFRLSDKIMLDLGADAVSQSMKYGDLCDVEHVLITHTHDDHLNPHMMMETVWTKTRDKTLNYYFTDEAYTIVDRWRESDWVIKGGTKVLEKDGRVAFHKLEYGVAYEIDEMKVIPFKGKHIGNVHESSAMYLVLLPDGKTLFYGLDSGFYDEETISALSNHKIDIFISEATCGTRRIINYPYHMDIYQVRDLTEILLNNGTLNQDSRIYLTHINHSTSYSQMEKAVEELNFPIYTEVAYDGMRIL